MNKIMTVVKDDKVIIRILGEFEEVAVIVKSPDNKETIFLPKSSRKESHSSYVSVENPERFVQQDEDSFFVEYTPRMKGEHKALFMIKNGGTSQLEHSFDL